MNIDEVRTTRPELIEKQRVAPVLASLETMSSLISGQR